MIKICSNTLYCSPVGPVLYTSGLYFENVVVTVCRDVIAVWCICEVAYQIWDKIKSLIFGLATNLHFLTHQSTDKHQPILKSIIFRNLWQDLLSINLWFFQASLIWERVTNSNLYLCRCFDFRKYDNPSALLYVLACIY